MVITVFRSSFDVGYTCSFWRKENKLILLRALPSTWNNPLIDEILYSHPLSARTCADIGRRNKKLGEIIRRGLIIMLGKVLLGTDACLFLGSPYYSQSLSGVSLLILIKMLICILYHFFYFRTTEESWWIQRSFGNAKQALITQARNRKSKQGIEIKPEASKKWLL